MITPYTVNAARMSPGLFGEKRGDISAAYSADKLSGGTYKPGVAVKVFTHDGKLWTNGGGGGKWSRMAYGCHELIAEQLYTGPDSADKSYEGLVVSYNKQRYRLGPETQFKGERSVQEFRVLLRGMYREGGMFTSGHTYHSFLRDTLEDEVWCPEQLAWVPDSGPHMEAAKLELAESKEWSKWDDKAGAADQVPDQQQAPVGQMEMAL